MTKQMTKWPTEAANKTLARWGARSDGLWSKEAAAKVLGISLGLGALFNEDIMAERHWMNAYNSSLRETPLKAVLHGRLDAVVEQVNKERELR